MGEGKKSLGICTNYFVLWLKNATRPHIYMYICMIKINHMADKVVDSLYNETNIHTY